MAILENVSKTVLHAIGPALRGHNSHEVKNGRVPMNTPESTALVAACCILAASAACVAWLYWQRRR